MQSCLHHALWRDGASGYFASANSGLGFYSLYGEIFNEENYNSVYIIKGGPGTGKSTFIDLLSERASGMGYETEVFLCSSDANSLDGLIIKPLRIAIIDGTAPHSREPVYPGACGEIIDLGALWSSSALQSQREQILSLGRKKCACYERAYRLLSAAGTAYSDMTSVSASMADDNKLSAAVTRLLNKYIKKNSDGVFIRRFNEAYTQRGGVSLGTFDNIADITVTVSASHGFSHRVIKEILRQSKARGIGVTAIPDALLPTSYKALYIHEAGLYIKTEQCDNDIISSTGEKHADNIKRNVQGISGNINCDRFIDKSIFSANRKKLRFTERIKNSLIDEALLSLSEAGSFHGQIEEIYKSAMDFDAMRELERKIEQRIFG